MIAHANSITFEITDSGEVIITEAGEVITTADFEGMVKDVRAKHRQLNHVGLMSECQQCQKWAIADCVWRGYKMWFPAQV